MTTISFKRELISGTFECQPPRKTPTSNIARNKGTKVVKGRWLTIHSCNYLFFHFRRRNKKNPKTKEASSFFFLWLGSKSTTVNRWSSAKKRQKKRGITARFCGPEIRSLMEFCEILPADRQSGERESNKKTSGSRFAQYNPHCKRKRKWNKSPLQSIVGKKSK